MPLTAGEKIKIILGRRGMNIGELAEKLGQGRSNLSNKLSRDNFSEKELQEIARVLECSYETIFILDGEKI